MVIPSHSVGHTPHTLSEHLAFGHQPICCVEPLWRGHKAAGAPLVTIPGAEVKRVCLGVFWLRKYFLVMREFTVPFCGHSWLHR